MKQQRKIQDYDWLYSFLRHYVDFVLKLSYRQIKYVGRERIPQDGAIIFAPNHTNALMDALVVLAMDHRAKVFVARAGRGRTGRRGSADHARARAQHELPDPVHRAGQGKVRPAGKGSPSVYQFYPMIRPQCHRR